jgi:hypothetical protein
MFGLLFVSIASFFISSHRCLDDSFFTNFQDLEAQDIEQQQRDRGKGPWPFLTHLLASSSITLACN